MQNEVLLIKFKLFMQANEYYRFFSKGYATKWLKILSWTKELKRTRIFISWRYQMMTFHVLRCFSRSVDVVSGITNHHVELLCAVLIMKKKNIGTLLWRNSFHPIFSITTPCFVLSKLLSEMYFLAREYHIRRLLSSEDTCDACLHSYRE